MSREYAEKRIGEALKLARGNSTKARQQVMAWCYEDPKLLQALSQPHLTGIVAHAISRVVYRLEKETGEESAHPFEGDIDMSPETFGEEIFKALSSKNAAVFGQERNSPPVHHRPASQSHIDAMKRLAGKDGKRKPGRKDSLQ